MYDVIILALMKTSLSLKGFTYDLPPERIALFPLEQRDESKLLVYQKGEVRHEHFFNLDQFIPENSLLFFNNTRVIQARLLFQKESGAEIEIFLLHPYSPSSLLLETMQAIGQCSWKCTIGNAKRWKPGIILKSNSTGDLLEAQLVNKEEGIVEFRWPSEKTFAEIISGVGITPLPPYLKRSPVAEDKDRYQTIYSKHEGAVAAPTAGLHFTPRVFDSLRKKNITTDFLTLHVSAGTFQPIKEEDAFRHVMHNEQVVITRDNIDNILSRKGILIPVGTTSMRTLESVYWYGVKLDTHPNAPFIIDQHDAYSLSQNFSVEDALRNVRKLMDSTQQETLTGETSIYIRPGYSFRVCEGLITNFHQPASTLILLVSAFIGEDWKKVYRQALDNSYRFLSYGDSSLLLP